MTKEEIAHDEQFLLFAAMFSTRFNNYTSINYYRFKSLCLDMFKRSSVVYLMYMGKGLCHSRMVALVQLTCFKYGDSLRLTHFNDKRVIKFIKILKQFFLDSTHLLIYFCLDVQVIPISVLSNTLHVSTLGNNFDLIPYS